MLMAPFSILIGALILIQFSIFYGCAGVRKLSVAEQQIFKKSAGSGWVLLAFCGVFSAGIWVEDFFLKLLLTLLPIIIVTVSGCRHVKKLKNLGFSADFVRRISRMNFIFSAGAFGFLIAVLWPVFCACFLEQ